MASIYHVYVSVCIFCNCLEKITWEMEMTREQIDFYIKKFKHHLFGGDFCDFLSYDSLKIFPSCFSLDTHCFFIPSWTYKSRLFKNETNKLLWIVLKRASITRYKKDLGNLWMINMAPWRVSILSQTPGFWLSIAMYRKQQKLSS